MNAVLNAKPIRMQIDPPDAFDPFEIDRMAKEKLQEDQASTVKSVSNLTDGIKRKSLSRMIEEYPQLRPPVIDGLLRRGEVANIIASPKMGKSYLAGGLALSIVSGSHWLGHETTQGKVLIIDNELHPETTKDRLCRIASAMTIDLSEFGHSIEVLSLRGALCDIHNLRVHLEDIKPGDFVLVVLDALYRTLPNGTSENDNAAMTAIFNQLDAYAGLMDCAIVVVHHSSKGDQSTKGVTDVGSGAGSISRAADSHLIIRPHATDDHAVLEAVTRSWKSPDPITMKWEYPIWTATNLKPEIKRPATARAAAQEKEDTEGKKMIIKILQKHNTPMRQQAVIAELPGGTSKALRLLKLMEIDGTVRRIEQDEEETNRTAVYWALNSTVILPSAN